MAHCMRSLLDIYLSIKMSRFLEKTSESPKRSSSAPRVSGEQAKTPVKSFYFFNPEVEFFNAGPVGMDWRFTKLRCKQWMTCGDPRKVKADADKIEDLPPKKPVARKLWADISSDSSMANTPASKPINFKIKIDNSPIKLEAPPAIKRSITKRKARSEFPGETESDERFVGQLKFYQLKKRFGFVRLDNEDIFLCEDEVVLSAISAKKFKATVLKNRNLKLSFKIKSYFDKGKLRRKAFDIALLNN
mmetsp:Transcript_16957/g.30484  ORF Transcript_16957/g.30484 Transcript_16957/m.30484 type:complete len:246 (-) Transcript_16957:338-1075(-)